MTAPFPTRAQEEWRYADLDALRPLWDQFAEPRQIHVPDGQSFQDFWLPMRTAVEMTRAEIIVEAGSSLSLFILNSAETYGRMEVDVTVHRGASFELHAANIGTGTSTNEIVTNVRHVEPEGRSLQVVRSVLGGKAVGSYLGRVEVARGAQQVDGEQSVKALLLDRGATANAKPELEIYADDVKCAHGATVGELDAGQLFYLQSRGLPPAEARALLLEGFVMGLWETVADDAQRSPILAAANDALRRVV